MLREHGLSVDWDGDPQRRICVAMRWQARLPGDPAAVAPPPGADFRPPPASGPAVGWAGLADRRETVAGWLRARHRADDAECSTLAAAAYRVSAYAAHFATRASASDTADYAARETGGGPDARRWQARRLIERIAAA